MPVFVSTTQELRDPGGRVQRMDYRSAVGTRDSSPSGKILARQVLDAKAAGSMLTQAALARAAPSLTTGAARALLPPPCPPPAARAPSLPRPPAAPIPLARATLNHP